VLHTVVVMYMFSFPLAPDALGLINVFTAPRMSLEESPRRLTSPNALAEPTLAEDIDVVFLGYADIDVVCL
jgi:hypothetical protein